MGFDFSQSLFLSLSQIGGAASVSGCKLSKVLLVMALECGPGPSWVFNTRDMRDCYLAPLCFPQ